MQQRILQLFYSMLSADAGDPDLIQHFTKVYSYARLIAETEGLDAHTTEILEAAALLHDIAIPLCNKKYGAHPGPLQEKEGPALAEPLLISAGFTDEETARVCTLIGEHHTWYPIDGIDHQILLEADMIVNSFENSLSLDAMQSALNLKFATRAGKRIYATMFGLTPVI